MPDAIFSDPRLVAVYDAFNPWSADTAFYLALAGAEPRRILDMGCGTGRLAIALAERGHAVTAVDPAGAMLAAARSKPGGGLVTWVEADARALELGEHFDLAIMTGHVFQVFTDDADVDAVLAGLRRHLASGGRLAFESRNPLARAWEEWMPDVSRTPAHVDGVGDVEAEWEVLAVGDGLVTFETRYRLLATGETLAGSSTLRFASQAAIADELARAGFAPVEWLGDWDGAPWTTASPEIIALAGAAG